MRLSCSIIVAADDRKTSKKNKSDNVHVSLVPKVRRKKLKKKPQKSSFKASTNAFGN